MFDQPFRYNPLHLSSQIQLRFPPWPVLLRLHGWSQLIWGIARAITLCEWGWFPYIVSNSVAALRFETINLTTSTDIDDFDAGVSVSATSRFLVRRFLALLNGIGFSVVQIECFRRFSYVGELKSNAN